MLMVLGASHHDLELTDLNRLAVQTEGLHRALLELRSEPQGPLAGWVVLATCNRLEIYLDAERFHDAIDSVTSAVAEQAGLGAAEAGALLKVRIGAPVAAHLFTVAAGLDSMVVGEVEIAGQVGRAFRHAQLEGTTTTALNALFQSAARTAKQVNASTDLGTAGRSVASVALDIALGGTDEPAGPRGLIIGTGAYARVVAAELRRRGGTELQVFSPSGRAPAFAARHDATPVDDAGLIDALAGADVVVSCSGSSDVLDEKVLAAAVARRGAPLMVIDLALRPDVPEAARELPGVRVVDLRTVAAHAGPAQLDSVLAAQDVVIAAVAAFEDQLAARRLDPAVVALRQHVSDTVTKELNRLRTKYDAEVAAELEVALHRVTQSLLHVPTVRARELARSGEGAGYLEALHTLFGIEVTGLVHDAVPPAIGARVPTAPEPASEPRTTPRRGPDFTADMARSAD